MCKFAKTAADDNDDGHPCVFLPVLIPIVGASDGTTEHAKSRRAAGCRTINYAFENVARHSGAVATDALTLFIRWRRKYIIAVTVAVADGGYWSRCNQTHQHTHSM